MKVKHSVFLSIALFIIYLLLDYINFAGILGLSINNINIDIFSVIFNTIVVIILYCITFYYIDFRQLVKDKNSKDTAEILLKRTYEECLLNMDFLNNRDVVSKYILPKIDGNTLTSESKVLNNFKTGPFYSFEIIMTLSSGGYISKRDLDEYLEIKTKYRGFIELKIVFYDLTEAKYPEQQIMIDKINNDEKELRQKLNKLVM